MCVEVCYVDISPQEFAVTKGDSTGLISTCYVLVNLVDFNDDAGLLPLVGMWICLILNSYTVAVVS